MSSHYLYDRQPGESQKQFTAFHTYLDLGPKRSLAKVGRELGKCKALMERWSSQWRRVARVEAHTNHLFHQADLEQQRQARGKIVTRDETLEELSEIVRADPGEVPKLRYSDKVRAAIHAVVQTEQLVSIDAAIRIADHLADVPELAAMLREWATGLASQHPEQLTGEHPSLDPSRNVVAIKRLSRRP